MGDETLLHCFQNMSVINLTYDAGKSMLRHVQMRWCVHACITCVIIFSFSNTNKKHLNDIICVCMELDPFVSQKDIEAYIQIKNKKMTN
jgi:hypothetical protein